jgi:isoleucyl-tRNA synthetase
MVEKGLVYRSKKPVLWSTGAQTALAEAEVEYQDKTSPAIFVKFVIETHEAASAGFPTDKPLSVVIWTTTPWTLPANLAIAVHADFDYVLLENAANGPDHRHMARLWLADNGLRTMRGCLPRAAQEAVAELLKLVQEEA